VPVGQDESAKRALRTDAAAPRVEAIRRLSYVFSNGATHRAALVTTLRIHASQAPRRRSGLALSVVGGVLYSVSLRPASITESLMSADTQDGDSAARAAAAILAAQVELPWVTATLAGDGYRTALTSGRHTIVADEPTSVGGSDDGPTPYDLLLASLGACTAMTMRMYAARKGWPLEEAVVRLRTARPATAHAEDCAECEIRPTGLTRLEQHVELRGPLSDEQKQRLLEIAERCPLKRSLEKGLRVETA
jgi:putative redox protein